MIKQALTAIAAVLLLASPPGHKDIPDQIICGEEVTTGAKCCFASYYNSRHLVFACGPGQPILFGNIEFLFPKDFNPSKKPPLGKRVEK